MRITAKELIQKPKVLLYDNLAKSGKCTGRLRVELEIFPSPRITWEFENLKNSPRTPNVKDNNLVNPIKGYHFTINDGFIMRYAQGGSQSYPYASLKGISSKAIFGNDNLEANFFQFYIPNTRFLEMCLQRPNPLVSVDISKQWHINLEVENSEVEWVKTENQNIGTLITTAGTLVPVESKRHKPKLTIDQASSHLETFNFLLSFANGGYVNPLYIEGWATQRKQYKHVAIATAPHITPLEQLGYFSWVAYDSNLEEYFKCFHTLEKMKTSTHWKDDLPIILTWYFQATQPQTSHFAKSWVVAINAAGAALERLAVLILVRDLNIRGLNSSKTRIKKLLEKIGITKARGYNDIGYISTFVDLRNDATHPVKTQSLSERQIWEYIEMSIMWIQEALLWRLGYNGKYTDIRPKNFISISPRYDLTLRDPKW